MMHQNHRHDEMSFCDQSCPFNKTHNMVIQPGLPQRAMFNFQKNILNMLAYTLKIMNNYTTGFQY